MTEAHFDYTILTNQTGVHDNLVRTVERHRNSPYQRPISAQQQAIFAEVNTLVQAVERPIILDCGCGTGLSTQLLSEKHPDHWVIGIDKSIHRLARNRSDTNNIHQENNAIWVRADLVGFIRLASQTNWPITKQYHLYPNPWPKSMHLKRRWYGHPIFPVLMQLSDSIEIRSNWRLYCEEWLLAAKQLGNWQGAIKLIPDNKQPLTLFERKYFLAKQKVYQLLLS